MTTADRDRLRELAETEASLRRLAMLVAGGAAPETVFDAVTKEALRRFGSGTARMIRYELDGTATILANEGTSGPHVKVGQAWENYPPTGLTATIQRTGAPARVDDYRDLPGGEPYAHEGLLRRGRGNPASPELTLHLTTTSRKPYGIGGSISQPPGLNVADVFRSHDPRIGQHIRKPSQHNGTRTG